MELHHLLPGSYCSDNSAIVCATGHRKLHYARVECLPADAGWVALRINGAGFQFRRTILTAG